MNKENAKFPYTRFAYIFMFLNSFLSMPLFISFIWSPTVGFYTFRHSMNSDPEGIVFFFLFIFSISICAFCLYFKKSKVAFIFSLLPEITFFAIIFFGMFGMYAA